MAFKGEEVLAGVGVPHLHRLVMTARGEAPAVRVKRYTEDKAGVSCEGRKYFLTRASVPNPHAVVIGARSDPGPVGAERHPPNP
jgi:hypothetical protein